MPQRVTKGSLLDPINNAEDVLYELRRFLSVNPITFYKFSIKLLTKFIFYKLHRVKVGFKISYEILIFIELIFILY